MRKSNFIRDVLCSTVIAGFAFTAATPALAQDAGDDENEEIVDKQDTATRVVITGTRLNVNPNLEAASPVLSVSDEQIEGRGVTRIEDLTNQLPQIFAGQSGEVSNGASGTATLNLRGLGAVRTLVLIDGRRLPYGSSQITAPNLDLIPTQLVERVDILTGGASAVYGSDAVGGVANFVLKRDFEGVEIDISGGVSQHGNDWDAVEGVLAAGNVPIPGNSWDGEEYTVTGTIGTNTADGRGNVTLYASYENREAITQDNRVFSACTLSPSSNPTSSSGGVGCVGSGNFRLFGGPGGFFFQQENGTLVPYVGGPAQTYNFGPRNFFQRPSERYQIYARGHYEIADNIEFFADASYTDNVSDAQVAETASFGIGAYSINCDNPFLAGNPTYYSIFGCSAADIAAGNDVSGITASHRNVEGGPRNSRLENSAFRLVGGVRGTIADFWDFEVFGQYAETSDTSISSNDFVVANLQQAFFAVRDASGNIVCRDPSGGCVPYNPFQRNGTGTAITPEQFNYLQGVGIVVGSTDQLVVGANVQADLGNYGIRSPFSSEGIAFLIGTEGRRDSLESIPDEISQVPGGGFTGVGGATLPVAGSVDVFEVYGELQVPLVTDRRFFEELVLAGQYRYSDYSASGNNSTTGFTTDAYGAQLTWIPVDGFKVRGQYQRSVRAPNVIELYTGQDVGLPNLSARTNSAGNTIYDPCATANPTATLAQCANSGVTATQYGNIVDVISGQTQGIFGGNPNLMPETSDTWTFGFVLTPPPLDGLTVSVDYFDITVEDFISAGIGAQTTLDNCIATGDPAFCGLITRDANGSLNSGTPGTGFLLTNLNIADLTTDGVDMQVSYNFDIGGAGDINLNYAATYLFSLDYVPFPGGAPIRCAGFLNNDCVAAVNPEYRHIASLGWNSDFGLDLTATWRHFGATKNVASAPELIDDQFDASNYFDLSMSYELWEGLSLRGGVLNVLNELPPLSASSGPPTGNGNTYPGIYDTGRYFFAGLNIKL